MSDHGHDADHGQTAVADSHADPLAELHFEKEELHYFEAQDGGAGRNIGVLLACVFCVLLVLMSGVTVWTAKHASVGHDPHSIPGGSESGGHH